MASSTQRGPWPLQLLKQWLLAPGSAELDLDDPATTEARVALIKDKVFLRKVYEEWYARLAKASEGTPRGLHVELGAGGGFLKERLPHVLTTDVLPLTCVDAACSAEALPFAGGALAALYLVNVFHHLPAPDAFLREAARCLAPGGRVVMIEPWNSPWARFVYTRFHHEPFDPAADWALPAAGGPLTRANGALPWIVFQRDRARLEDAHPGLRVTAVRPLMPAAYLLSGGLTMRSLAPGWAYPIVRGVERVSAPLNRQTAMFASIVIERR